jgi:uncharacterized protein YcbK (DUF882 family)
MNGPSTHLTWAELACKDAARTPYPDRFLTDGRLSELAALFEEVRALLGGRPLVVISAYRTPAHNRKVGGAPNSQHLQGRALDLRPPLGMTPDQMVGTMKDAHKAGLIPSLGGLGVYRTFVHIDTRKAGRLVAWNGGAQLKDDRA